MVAEAGQTDDNKGWSRVEFDLPVDHFVKLVELPICWTMTIFMTTGFPVGIFPQLDVILQHERDQVTAASPLK